jgi:hypothetical protein
MVHGGDQKTARQFAGKGGAIPKTPAKSRQAEVAGARDFLP